MSKAILMVEHVSKYFGGLKAVSDVSFEVEKGSIIGLIGPNGAGKTTLFNMIACCYPPDKGSIIYEGQNIVGLPPDKVNRLGIARTFQIPKPFGELTLLENIMVGAFRVYNTPKVARKKAEEIYGLLKFSASMGEIGLNLTTPDKRRLELARALATEPKLLLLDEVLAGCNPQEKKDLEAIIVNLRDGRKLTVIVVEHDIKAIVNISDRVIVLDRGEKIIEDKPEVVVNDERVIKVYLGEEYLNAEGRKS